MEQTSASLIARVQRGDPEAWGQFVGLYQPFLMGWLRRYLVKESEIDDLVQETLLGIHRVLPTWKYDPRQRFRSYLKAHLLNRLRGFWRKQSTRQALFLSEADMERELASFEDPNSELSNRWDREHDLHVVTQLLTTISPDFEPVVIQVFQRMLFDGRTAEELATEFKITKNYVFVIKSRVMKRLRTELADLIPPEEDR